MQKYNFYDFYYDFYSFHPLSYWLYNTCANNVNKTLFLGKIRGTIKATAGRILVVMVEGAMNDN